MGIGPWSAIHARVGSVITYPGLSYHVFQSLLDKIGQYIGKTWIQANCMCSVCYSLQKRPIKNPVSAELHHVGVFRYEWVSTLSTHMTALWVLKYWNCFISCVSQMGAAVKTVPNPNKEGKSDLRCLRTCGLYCTVHIGLNITLFSSICILSCTHLSDWWLEDNYRGTPESFFYFCSCYCWVNLSRWFVLIISGKQDAKHDLVCSSPSHVLLPWKHISLHRLTNDFQQLFVNRFLNVPS